MSKTRGRPIKLPTEEQVRERLTVLVREANTLRRVLRIVRRHKNTAAATGGASNAI